MFEAATQISNNILVCVCQIPVANKLQGGQGKL